MTPTAALWFLPFVVPIALWVSYTDMKWMKIPNKAVMATVAVFAIVGLIALPFEEYLWRWLHLLVILVAGFVAASIGLMGAGDAKFAAAMAPFIALSDVGTFCFLFAAALIGAFVTHRLARSIPAVINALPDWESWHRKKDFPMGLALGPSLAIYLLWVWLG